MKPTRMLLIRVIVGKVADKGRFQTIMREVPIVQGDPEWNCVTWIKNALIALELDGKALGTSKINWDIVRDTAMKYCQDKKDQHRFDGQGQFDMSKAPTFDLLEGKEIIP